MAKKKEPQDITERIPDHRDWQGFRWTDGGKYLVSPDGDHISAARLQGLMWRDYQELRSKGWANRKSAEANRKSKKQLVKVVIVELAEYQMMVNGKVAG